MSAAGAHEGGARATQTTDVPAEQARAVATSSWLNAWSLWRGCTALGVAFATTDRRPELPLPIIDTGRDHDWLLLTDERGLRHALAGQAHGRFLPQAFPLALLDDKWAFAQWLAEDPLGPQGLAQWPVTDIAHARYPLMLKARHSWQGDSKLPRGWVCASPAQAQDRLGTSKAQGLHEPQLFLQEWLGGCDMALLSVGGFFDVQDEARNLACVTRRLADYRERSSDEGPSSSAMLATVPDDLGLVSLAERVLRRLGYRGPYEIEFVVVPGRPPLVLELNPRFWMQHGLYVAQGNGLLRRYFGMETADDHRSPPPRHALWIDGTWLLRRLLRADLAGLRLMFDWCLKRGYRCTMVPDLRGMFSAAVWRLRRRGSS